MRNNIKNAVCHDNFTLSRVPSKWWHLKSHRRLNCVMNWWPVDSPHKRPVTLLMCPFGNVIMLIFHWGNRVNIAMISHECESLPTWLLVQQLVEAATNKISKHCSTAPLCWESAGDWYHWWFPSQRISNVESVSISWLHHTGSCYLLKWISEILDIYVYLKFQ